jgi:CheY-like chemotaxis protein
MVTRARVSRILIIEDNTDAAQSLKEALELGGHEVAAAHDGNEGLSKARESKPDVVLCDIGLPAMDGYEVARTLRADPALRGTRLVAVSGYASPEDQQRATESGFEQHVAKPPNLEKLQEQLASMSRESL